MQINAHDTRDIKTDALVDLLGKGYNDSVFIDNDLNILIVGFDGLIVFVDISDLQSIKVISK